MEPWGCTVYVLLDMVILCCAVCSYTCTHGPCEGITALCPRGLAKIIMFCFYVSQSHQFAVHIPNLRIGLTVSADLHKIKKNKRRKEFLVFNVKAVEWEDHHSICCYSDCNDIAWFLRINLRLCVWYVKTLHFLRFYALTTLCLRSG